MTLLSFEKTITPEEIINGWTLPINILPSPGVWFVIIPVKFSTKIIYESLIYENASQLWFFYDKFSSGDAQWEQVSVGTIDNLLTALVNEFYCIDAKWSTEFQLFENQGISMKVTDWNPEWWDSSVVVTTYYFLMEV